MKYPNRKHAALASKEIDALVALFLDDSVARAFCPSPIKVLGRGQTPFPWE